MLPAPSGILVSDRATALKFWVMKDRQVCWAHLIRKFVSFAERDGPTRTLGRELLDCAGVVFAYWGTFKMAYFHASNSLRGSHPCVQTSSARCAVRSPPTSRA